MKYIALIALLLSSAVACFEKKAEFSVGQCVHAVDGNTSYKITKVDGEKMFGTTIVNKAISGAESALPAGRTFTQVPCP